MSEPNYFTCTLGQAATLFKDGIRPETVNELLETAAEECPDSLAVGFPSNPLVQHEKEQVRCYTFQQVLNGSEYAAKILAESIPNLQKGQQTVALLCPSTEEFLFTWLGLIRLGHSVLLVAPQNRPPAILHLCKVCNVQVLLHDDIYQEPANHTRRLSADQVSPLICASIPLSVREYKFKNAIRAGVQKRIVSAPLSKESIAYFFHTSGTSSGLPKPIPQSHNGAVHVLPRFRGCSDRATFTTTPLYHGGVADLFRAWTSSAPIWLFPGNNVPITARNIKTCYNMIREYYSETFKGSVAYFSSVPYVLQLLGSESDGLEFLKSMQIVGVGGAALPAESGDALVNEGINLVSRYGSAECGFLLSSHREYSTDKEWQYLRSESGAEALKFEMQDDPKLCELVVTTNWPHVSKTNRPDGSFATADLFSKHPEILNAWRYHSRSDAQLTLITGKKFDPSPMEAAIATSTHLSDVVIFGDGRPFPGALLFRSRAAESLTDHELVQAVEDMVEKINSDNVDHARIPRNMLIPMTLEENGLEKSSKGTLLRRKAYERHFTIVENAYERLFSSQQEFVPDTGISTKIRVTVQKIVGTKVDGLRDEDDLYSRGVDSVGAIQVRYLLQQLVPDSKEIPLGIVEECGTISRLSDWVLSQRNDDTESSDDRSGEKQDLALMEELVERYGDMFGHASSSDEAFTPDPTQIDVAVNKKEIVLLTGATGALGVHILSIYRTKPSIGKIYCLVRGADSHAAYERVSKALESRVLPPLPLINNSKSSTSSGSNSSTTSTSTPIVTILPCKLSDPHLGLSPPLYAALLAEVTLVIHTAWTVNFRLHLPSFVNDHIRGTCHILVFAAATHRRARFVFASSTASVSNATASSRSGNSGNDSALATTSSSSILISERPSSDPCDASPLGYSRSKWVAERLCHLAAMKLPPSSSPNDEYQHPHRITVVRVGQLSGDTATGVWNAQEAYPRMLAGARETGCLPALKGERLDWLPVDVAARGIVEVGGSSAQQDGGMGVSEAESEGEGEDEGKGTTKDSGARVLHLLHRETKTTWEDVMGWAKARADFALEIVQVEEWLRRLEELAVREPGHAAVQLLGLWKETYGTGSEDGSGGGGGGGDADEDAASAGAERVFETTQMERAAPVLKTWRGVDEAYFGKLWDAVMAGVPR